MLQVYSIKVALIIYEHLLPVPIGRSISKEGREKQRNELSNLKQCIEEWNLGVRKPDAPYTAQVFAKVLEYIVAEQDTAKAAAARDAIELLNRLLQFRDELLDFDREQFTFFRDRIMSQIS
jgi:hypothetical protein